MTYWGCSSCLNPNLSKDTPNWEKRWWKPSPNTRQRSKQENSLNRSTVITYLRKSSKNCLLRIGSGPIIVDECFCLYKARAIPKETIGITEEQKIAGPGAWESMCNPITQAEILNNEGTEFNILVGLCVGHDSLFIKYAQAPVTILVVKDRVFGHNPVAGLYQAGAYYRKLMRKEPLDSHLTRLH